MDLNSSKILVTGGSGFIGASLINKLILSGANVHGVARKETSNIHGAVWHYGDLAEHSFVESLIEEVQPEVVFHLAGHVVGLRDVSQVMPAVNSNFLSTLNLLFLIQKTLECLNNVNDFASSVL